MKRLSSSLMSKDNIIAQGSTTPMTSIIGSGQHGYAEDVSTVLSNAAYVPRPLVCILLNAPRGFDDLPNSEVLIGTLKELMENGSRTISGLRATLTAEFTSNQIGHGNEVQEDIAKVTRERSVPVHTFTERYGKPINRFLTMWIEYFLGNGVNSIPKIATMSDRKGPADLLPDYTSCTCLYVEPDALHQNVVEAWIITNMHPKTAGQVEAGRDLSSPGQTIDYSIEFTGIGTYGDAVRETAQKIWSAINLTGADASRRTPFITNRSARVAARDDAGYDSAIEDLKSEQI